MVHVHKLQLRYHTVRYTNHRLTVRDVLRRTIYHRETVLKMLQVVWPIRQLAHVLNVVLGLCCITVLNCNSYSSLGNNTYTCSNCTDGFINSFGLTCYIANGCLSSLSNGGCTECADGYYISGFSCINGSTSLPGCSIMSINLTCIYCFEGFSLNNGTCSLSTDAVVNNQTTSLTNTTINQSIVLPSTTISLPNCLTIDQSNTKCSVCDSTTYLTANFTC
jgi:hypothetical protein